MPGPTGSYRGHLGRLRRRRRQWNTWALTEVLEGRQLLAAAAPANLLALGGLAATPAALASSSTAVTNANPQGLTPAQVKNAYDFAGIQGDGSGQTLAIIDAYNDPTIQSDVQAFDAQFGLPDNLPGTSTSFLTKVDQSGGTAYPATSAGWSLETSLDVEWAHAMAPGAKILLVEANSGNLSDLLSAVDYARNQPGVSAVSMSWGTYEFPQETAYDNIFTTPAGHAGVTFVAASGDDGGVFGPIWPAVSPNVLSVGGTTLTAQTDGTYVAESGWSGSNGGFSAFEPEPGYQSAYSPNQTGVRTTPDVSFNADPASGFAVYDSTAYQSQSGWFQVGGTSAGAPQWAALLALANQARATYGLSPLDGASQTLPGLYFLSTTGSYAAGLHDVQAGNNAYFAAGSGYDLVSGLGTPIASGLVNFAVTGSPTVSPQASAVVAVTAQPAASQPVRHAPAAPQQPTQTNASVTVNGQNLSVLFVISLPVTIIPPASAAPAAGMVHSALIGPTAVSVSSASVRPPQPTYMTTTDGLGSFAVSEEPELVAPIEGNDLEPGPALPGDAAPVAPVPLPAAATPANSAAALRALESAGAFCASAGAAAGFDLNLSPAALPASAPQAMAATGLALLLWTWREKRGEGDGSRRVRLRQL